MSEEDKPQNKKQLPQIQQETELIATIVKGIRQAAQDAAKSEDSSDSTLNNSGRDDTPTNSRQSINSAMKTHSLVPSHFTRDTAKKYTIERSEVKAFAPLVFKKIRDLLNIPNDEYIKSWTLPESKLEMSTGAGRSGSLFLKSDDKKYLLKTIPHDELETFLTLLPDYFQYIVENPDSLIMRVLGLFRIKARMGSSLYIIVFTNILFTTQLDIEEIYDLKGRVPKPGKQGRNRGKKGIVFKDNDLERVFNLSTELHPKFIQTIQADIKFLGGHNIMDYSFLIGVAKVKEGENREEFLRKVTETKALSTFRQYDGSIISSSQDEFYLMGIIDCLTDYSTKKKIAHAMKITLWTPETLSTVDATTYSERITKFMDTIFPKPGEATATTTTTTTTPSSSPTAEADAS